MKIKVEQLHRQQELKWQQLKLLKEQRLKGPAKHHMFLENNSVKDLKGNAQRIPAMLHHMLLESNSVKDLKGDIDMDNDDAEMDQPKAVKL